MARYPESLIEEIRERVDLLDLVSRYVSLKKNGTSWRGLCPFHSEKTPSFNVRPDKGFYKCFGCGKGGDVFEFIIAIKGVEFVEAVEELAEMSGIPLPRSVQETPEQAQKHKEKKRLQERLTHALTFYRQTLKSPKGEQARRYLEQRGLKQEVVERFQLGYAPPGWSNLLRHFGNDPSVFSDLEKVGLIASSKERGTKYDRFRHRIIFPIFDMKGRCVAFGGRVMGPDKPKYINSPETSLYHKGDILYGLHGNQEAIQRAGQVLVVEGYMDLIALANHGINHVVATLGTALTHTHLRLIWQRTQRVVFCFDGDQAGKEAAWRALERVIDGLQADRNAQFLFLDQNDDPDEVIKREGAEGFKRLLEQAVPLIEFMIQRLGKDLSLGDPEGRAALIHRIRPLLSKVGDPLLRELYADMVGQRFGVPQQRVLPHACGKEDSTSSSQVAPSPWTRILSPSRLPKHDRLLDRHARPQTLSVGGRNVEQLLIYLLLLSPCRIEEHEDQLGELTLENHQFSLLLTDLLEMERKWLEKGGSFLIQHLSSSELAATARNILANEEVVPESEQDELLGCMVALQIKQTKKELQKAIAKVGQDPHATKQDYDNLLGLKLDLKRLQQSKLRPVPLH